MRFIPLFLLPLAAVSAFADVTLPSVVSSHMVLQRDMPVPVWGWAEAGEKVTVTFAGQTKEATAGADGKWSVKLDALPVNAAPQEMKIKGKNEVALTDILVGEVWIGSGQSNMQWDVNASMNAKEEIPAANYPNIRLFNVPLVSSPVKKDDLKASWEACSPKSVPKFSAVLYFMGRQLHKELNVPMGLIADSWGGSRIEPWTPIEGFDLVPSQQENAKKLRENGPNIEHGSGKLHGLYNAMIHPIVPFAIRGAVWYQGESNNGEGMLYLDRMKALIGGWRAVWKQGDFPFYHVQIAPFTYGGSPTALAELWEAQTESAKQIPHTGMAVINDIGNLKDIHPQNKQEAGRRLALIALAKDYGRKDLVYSGPAYASHAVEGNKVRVKFEHTGSGLVSRDGKPLSWFEVAGADGKFVTAEAAIDGKDVVVSAASVMEPKAVRFAFNQLAEPNLMNKEGLPAGSFRTK
ncbi:MAG TPA: sialate O-acetylesterase [Verrucomicrobiales bacterium]|nr:sialate O-acetylesterase [Verrucomicrobiales bacterium]